MKKIGFVLVAIGLALTIFTTVTYFTKEKVVDIGILEITANEPHRFNWSPLVGVAVMVIGGVFVWQGSKK